MPNLELEGRLVQKFPPTSGRSARGDWSKQEFLVEYQDGNFPTTVVMNVWGADKVADLQRFQQGDMLRISFRPSSREFNGRWYTDLRAWRVQGAAEAAQEPDLPLQAQQSAQQGAPAPQPPQYDIPAPTLDDMPGDKEDDLPF